MRCRVPRLFTLCSAVSLLMCAAVCGLWVRSLHRVDFAVVEWHAREVRVWTNPQVVTIGVADLSNADEGWEDGVYSGELGSWYFQWRQPMPAYERGRLTGTAEVTLPLWLVLLSCVVMPSVFALRLDRKRRGVRKGLCPRCGYDLRASPERCPECGGATSGKENAR